MQASNLYQCCGLSLQGHLLPCRPLQAGPCAGAVQSPKSTLLAHAQAELEEAVMPVADAAAAAGEGFVALQLDDMDGAVGVKIADKVQAKHAGLPLIFLSAKDGAQSGFGIACVQ